METIVNVDQVSYIRNEKKLFKPISFALSAGELLVIQGKNGIGKTTLLRCIAGIIEPSAGKFHFNLHHNNSYNSLGYIGHQLALTEEITVIDNLHYYCELEQTEMNSAALLKTVHLFEKRNHKVAKLSAGQKKRLALTRLLIKPKTMWLIDEPYTHLDHAGCDWLTHVINEQVTAGTAIIISHHGELPANLVNYKTVELTH